MPRVLLQILACLACLLAAAVGARAQTDSADGFAPIAAGPLYDRFPLTLFPGTRTEALGPFYYRVDSPLANLVAVPPLFSILDSPFYDARQVSILPPLISYHRFGTQTTLMITPLLTFYGGDYQNDVTRQRTMLFPFYFRQKSSDPALRYTAVFPFYGTVKGIFQRTEAHWVMAPLFIESWKRDIHTRNYLYPIFHLRTGNGLSGWQFWPFAGYEQKALTQRTNDFGEVRDIPGYQKTFVLWPMFFDEWLGLGTTNLGRYRAAWPFYTTLRSPEVDTQTAFFSLYSHTTNRVQQYEQWGFPWPIWVIARGEGKHITRFIPFYNYGSNNVMVSRSYLWPGYFQRTLDTGPALVTRTRVMLYLWSEVAEEIKATGEMRRRQSAWPFMVRQKSYDGSTRLQVFAPLEPMLPASETVERVFSPLWSVYRAQYNGTNGASSQSVLWNLYRHDTTPDVKRWSLLWGFFQGRQTQDTEELRIFFIPIRQPRNPALAGRCTIPPNRGNAAALWPPPPAPAAAPPRRLASATGRPAPPTHGAARLMWERSPRTHRPAAPLLSAAPADGQP